MSEPWHDINAPGLRQKPKKPESNKPAVTDDVPPPPPKKPLVKLSDGKFVPPDEGAEINKKCPVQVSVEYLDDSAKSMKKVTFSLYSNYNGQTSNLSHYADGYEKDGIAQAELILYPPPGYQDGDKVDYFFKAEHIRGEKVIDSADITLPQETTTIILQKGHYDENGAASYDKPQSGDNFKPNNVVKKLQGDLITTAFLPEGSDDGFFGDQTDKAVNDFQDYAIKSIRMKRSVGKTETADATLDQQAPDGIVGKKTRDELDKWLQSTWIKPIPTLRHGEYDDTGVQNGKGQRGADDHHQGTPVVEAQQDLQNVGVYSDGAIDGWFFDKMLSGVNIFQSAAADATFSVNGKTTQFDQKLTGYQKGEMCPKTQEYLKMVVDKSGVVLSKKGFKEFAKAVGDRESSDNYKAENQFGYLGRYQFGMARIMDLSNMVERKGETKGFGNDQFQWKQGYSKDNFLNDNNLQDGLFKKHALQYASTFKKKYSDQIGKTIKLDSSYFSKYAKQTIAEVKISTSGLVGGAHIAGPGAVKDFLESGEDKTDGNGTPISEYVYIFSDFDLDQ